MLWGIKSQPTHPALWASQPLQCCIIFFFFYFVIISVKYTCLDIINYFTLTEQITKQLATESCVVIIRED